MPKQPTKASAKPAKKAAVKAAPAKSADPKAAPAKAAKRTPSKAVATQPAVPQSPAPAASAPTHQQIAEHAHHLWQQRGAHHGAHVDDWLHAEHQLKSK